jgi:hypothetical protein
MMLVYIMFVHIAFRLVSGRRRAVRSNLGAVGNKGGLARSTVPTGINRGQVLQSDIRRLREGGVLWCESSIPSESVAVSTVRGGPALLG